MSLIEGEIIGTFRSKSGREVLIRAVQMSDTAAIMENYNAISAEDTYLLVSGEQFTHTEEEHFVKQSIEAMEMGNKVHLLAFVGDMLVLARMDKGGLKAEPVALHDEITRAMEAVKQRYPAVALSFADVGDTTAIPMIKSLAMQVFLNIMHNAAEHADTQNGRVDVALRQSPEGTVFSCANNGAPISEDKKPLIFAKIPSNTGEGLGLYLVKMISDTLGWRVWFETGEHGTTFYVLIPPESPAAA